MRNGAYAEICGELKEDIVIKKAQDGSVCGLIHVLNNCISKPSEKFQNNKATIPVLLKGVNIINAHAHSLKKGERVWLVGKFEVIKKVYATFGEFGFEKISSVVISMHDKNRLRVITQDAALSPDPLEKEQIINTEESPYKAFSWAANFN